MECMFNLLMLQFSGYFNNDEVSAMQFQRLTLPIALFSFKFFSYFHIWDSSVTDVIVIFSIQTKCVPPIQTGV